MYQYVKSDFDFTIIHLYTGFQNMYVQAPINKTCSSIP